MPLLDAVLDDAIALMLAGRGRLLEDSAALQLGETLEESEDGVLIVALEGHGLAPRDPAAAMVQSPVRPSTDGVWR